MIVEKCLDCRRPAKEHYYAVQGQQIKPNARNVAEVFTLAADGYYPLWTKWTRTRISVENFYLRFCRPHRLLRLRVEIGSFA